MSNTQTYSLKIDNSITSCTLQLQKYSTATLTPKGGKPVTSITGKGGDTIEFTIANGQYVNAFVDATFASNAFSNTSSQCNICFVLAASSSFIWQVTGKMAQGDNPSMFSPPTSGTGTEHDTSIIEVIVPTEANPPVHPSVAQVLSPSQVYIVDYDAKNQNLLVRGNSPLGKEVSGNQLIDFTALEEAIIDACKAASIAPAMGSYNLHDISLLSEAEEYIWADEYYSFGNTGAPSMETKTWFPLTPTQLPGLNNSNKKGQWCRWNIQPDLIGQDLADLTKELKTAMASTVDKSTLDIYYVHCASGHDRTGMVSATYIANLGMKEATLDEAFVMGTTLQKQNPSMDSNDIIADCYDWKTNMQSKYKSRCFMADDSYNTTFLKAIGILQPQNAPYSLGQNALKNANGVDKPYVIEAYPFPVLM
ncbi:MAG: tyrosine-protein phosphatase [Bacteroidota bacterium]